MKVYGPSGGQYVPPHDAASIDAMQQVTWIKRTPFAEALAAGKVVYCQEEVDAAFIKAVLAQSIPGPRNLKILYSPLHGVGASAVYPVLSEAGFRDVEIFGPHAEPNGDFPNVPKHVANPENPAVFDAMIEHAKQSGAELILATDPDCDRLGCAVRKSLAADAPWTTLTGNQLGSLLADFLLAHRQAAGTLTPQTLRRQNAGDHRTDPPHRRPLRRRRRPAICTSASSGSAPRWTPAGRRISSSARRNRTAFWPATTCATRTPPWPRC